VPAVDATEGQIAETAMRNPLPLAIGVACAVPHFPAKADPVVQALAAATGVVVLAEVLWPSPDADRQDFLAFDAGRFDVSRNKQPATEFELEYDFGAPVLWKIAPIAGVGATTDKSWWGYGGIRLDSYWGARVIIAPSFAVAGYSRGNGKGLGTPAVLGRFGIDIEYVVDRDIRIGAGFHHMSNGKVLGQEQNPGTEFLGAIVSIAIK
jgi:lipid A 3-O-deacylase